LIHHFIFSSGDCFLFKENRADCWLRNGVVFLTQEFQRLNIEVFKSAGIDLCTLPDGRVSA